MGSFSLTLCIKYRRWVFRQQYGSDQIAIHPYRYDTVYSGWIAEDVQIENRWVLVARSLSQEGVMRAFTCMLEFRTVTD